MCPGRMEDTVHRMPVESSSIASVGYDVGRRLLEVEFKESGDVYQYLEVPSEVYEGLLASESRGRYLNTSIKGVFEYRRV